MTENKLKRFRSPWPDEYFELTSEQERRDERFVERVSICLEDGECDLASAVCCARMELSKRVNH